MSEYLKGSSKDPTIFQNEYSYKEVWHPEIDTKEMILDAATVGLLVIGMRAFLNPKKYGDSDFIKNAIETTRLSGYIGDNGITAPVDLLDIAFPQSNGNH